MTKGELKKCEGLMYDAIGKANNSKKDYATYENFLKEGKRLTQNLNYGWQIRKLDMRKVLIRRWQF